MPVEVRLLEREDADQLFQLRRRALTEEPFAFLSSPEDDVASSPDAVRDKLSSPSPDAVVFGAFDGERLIGMVGLARDKPIKASHRACIWGVFVAPEYRGRRIGAELLSAAVKHARQLAGLTSVYLSVSERTPGAKRLYESAGFEVWGLEPDCIRYQGESAREYHLALSLE